ncbi:low choriolytic enzyme-like [Pristis pectinata]|uniref:low choriolytic enzyme-like n=1 Tax=Pristis pectinata TaxID=685728 RepID=UPI00223CAD4F|nr:low choriolytic enzyme-like [Pristis pectinata]
MDLTVAILLTLSQRCIHSALMNYVNSTLEDGLKSNHLDTDEQDVFSIILKNNEKLLKQTGNTIIQYGDVLVDKSRNAMVCQNTPRSCLWPSSDDGNVYVPYTVTKDFSEDHKKLIKKCLDEISSLTCVKFYYRRKNEAAYIAVASGSGCFAHVGYRKSERKLSLEIPQCVHFSLIAHEFLHAIGFQHEHCRSDRDNYITVLKQNIIPGQEFNFNLLNTNNLGTAYDYTSVMHYGRRAFAKQGTVTMIPKPDPNVELGQNRGPTAKDIQKINKLYQCDTCGYMFVDKSGNFTTPNFPLNYPNNADCKWIIRSPIKYQILVEFSEFSIQEFAACLGDHVTVYDGADKLSKVLVRPACGAENPAAISTVNEILITFTSIRRLPARGFSAKYRFVECGRMVKNKKGDITRKASRSKDTHCFWVLLTKMKRKIKIHLRFLGPLMGVTTTVLCLGQASYWCFYGKHNCCKITRIPTIFRFFSTSRS